MAKTNEELSSALVKAGNKMTALALKDQAKNWFDKNAANVSQLMGSASEAKRLYLAVMNTVSRNAKLLECEPSSIFRSLVQCAELKLYPGPLQEAALVPFWNSKKGVNECQFMPQYQGLLKLAFNAGFLRKVTCRVVYSNEEFEYQCGSREFLKHSPIADEAERGERKGVYAILRTKYGEEQITYLTAAYIQRTKGRSKGAGRSDSPWAGSNPDDLDWMWKKTALKQALKLIPKSAELANAIELDNAIENEQLATTPLVDMDVSQSSMDAEQEDLPGPIVAPTTKA